MGSALRSVGRLAGIGLGAVVLSTLAVGWCYVLRAPTVRWPGPQLDYALPLDHLAGHDAVSLIVFVFVLAAAGYLVGALARVLRYDGFTIALSVGVGVGAWLYLVSAVSLYIVDQSTLAQAFDSTRHLQAVYLAGGLSALGVAVVARRDEEERWLTRVVPGCVAILGIVYVLSAPLPRSYAATRALGGMLMAPGAPETRALEVPAGILLFLAARGLARRSRRALLVAMALLAFLLLVRLFDGFNVVLALLTVVVLVSLAARRADFGFAGDPVARRSGPIRALAFIALAFVYGVVALSLNRTAVGFGFRVTLAMRNTYHSLLFGAPPSTYPLPDAFADWFPWTLRVIVLVGIVWGAVTWLAPWRHRWIADQGDLQQAASLVGEFGRDSLSPFTLRHDKALFLFPDSPAGVVGATTVIAYRVVRGVAIISGDPIGPPEQAAEAIAAFRAMCAEHGWRFALLGASERLLGVYRAGGLHPLYHGDEAVIDIDGFSLSGGKMKSVRQAVGRLAKKGYTTKVALAGDLSEAEREDLLDLEATWLGGAERKGFVMELDELFRLDGEDAIFVIGREPAGALVGFLEIAVCPASDSLSLSSMPRAEGAPNGLNAALIVALTEWAAERGFRAISLNFSPAARLLDQDADPRGLRKVARLLLLALKRLLGLQLDNLLLFNRQFCPRWQPRYVVVDHWRYVPKMLVAAMAAERYLPFADLLRGRDWRGAPSDEVAATAP